VTGVSPCPEDEVKFTNLTDEVLFVPDLGVSVGPGEQTPDLKDDQALGYVHQSTVWKPDHPRVAQRLIDDEAKQHAPEEDEPEASAEPESTTEQGTE
jgi:hypothetical protein